MSEVSNPSIREAKAINEAYGRSQEVVSKIVIGAVFNEIKEDCDCPECMKKDKNCEVKVETKFGVDTTAGENIAKAGPSAV